MSRRILIILSMALLSSAALAGRLEQRADATIIHLDLWDLPNPANPQPAVQADVAVVKEFVRRFPEIFAARYRDKYQAQPEKYGHYNWDNLSIVLQRVSGISIAGAALDSGPLMAIAGGVAPDVIYVNFRQSDTYIRQGFLYPLDDPADQYFSDLSAAEQAFLIHPRIRPVIERAGPDGQQHVWALPQGGIMGKVVLYRKDILDEHQIPYPDNDWTWQDLYRICRQVSDPARGIYGIRFGRGFHESFSWINFLWSAGGQAVLDDGAGREWRAAFNSPAGLAALDFYTRLCSEPWLDSNGRKRYGYAYKEAEGGRKWESGQIAFNLAYIDEKVFAEINPDLTGMVPVPRGPGGQRGGELNAKMQGIFGGVDNPVIRDAAWEYLRFMGSRPAMELRTSVLVAGGMGRFVNPRYLRMFGYEDIVRLAPPGWEECFEIAIATGQPEPYGKNCQLIYDHMTKPLVRAEQLALAGRLGSGAQRSKLLQQLLDQAAHETNEQMLNLVAGPEKMKRRLTALAALLLIAGVFIMMFRKLTRLFSAPDVGVLARAPGRWRKQAWAYLLLLPALLLILFWRYIPLGIGSALAFQDYQIMGRTSWVGLDNFGAILWDRAWWQSLWNSARYAFLVISLSFLPPVVLAVFLQEVPRGKIVWRTLFYLPAMISGLVIIYLWKSFYEPTEQGILNAMVLAVPAWGYIALGALLLWLLGAFARRLWLHQRHWPAWLCLAAGLALGWFFFALAWPLLQTPELPWWRALASRPVDPYRWLLDPKTAMFCCVLPVVWAGLGPGCLIYLAALKGVADDFYEAADIDGATFIDKILFIVIPILKPLLIIQFIGIFIGAWNSDAYILAMTGGASQTEVAGLHIFYKAYLHLQFGPAVAMAWVLGVLLIGFTVYQLRILARLEFHAPGNQERGQCLS